jgi:hypothetical protein
MLLVAVVSGSACGAQNKIEESLNRHRQQWAGQEIGSYRYQLRVNCFCPPEVTEPVIVEVRNGATISVSYAATGRLAESRYFEKYDTVDELFIVIDDALGRKADEISVTYDEKLGFPTRIYIDFVKQAVDDEIAYDVSGFQVLN